MAKGRAIITFEGIDLDNCIKQGLAFTGYAKCPNCKQTYAFQIRLKTREKRQKYADAQINGQTVTVPLPDAYDVSIKFSGNVDPSQLSGLPPEPELPEVDPPCDPCSRCTPRCAKLMNS
jgi:hypothetical protein